MTVVNPQGEPYPLNSTPEGSTRAVVRLVVVVAGSLTAILCRLIPQPVQKVNEVK